ncbi:metallophosphoesterase family protein [Cytobacillus sp. FSL R5-0569]|uniref:metallophosphoesterase family protein n=1 Tax=Cytobacillus TaxID=2675230 RepID=UPI00278537F4|nr:metallophosphoesterase family protein [Cytobacillus kochii]MDQ0185355.1 protein phosphatase [Cytobacillus kochii]
MAIAIISDIHGNLTALEAVLHHIKERKIDKIFCLGDLIGKGPSGLEVVHKVRETCDVVLQGNWDDFIIKPIDSEEIEWHQKQLEGEAMDYLQSLPFHYDFYMSGKYIRLYHASAKSVYHRVIPMKATTKEKNEMFEISEWIKPLEQERKPDVIGFGDIHAALIEPIQPQRTLFNCGSVGNSLDIPQATFAIIHGNYQSKQEGPFSIEIVRIPYDIEREIHQAEIMGMPNVAAYALELREARYRGAPTK